MTLDRIFDLASSLAMLGWFLLLLVNPIWIQTPKLVSGIIVAMLCITYAGCLIQGFSLSDFSRFGSLEGVMELFKNKEMVTAGWIHYLAFDLFIGSWICSDARKKGINHWVTVPCLLLSFMMGPVGLLLYFLFRFLSTKSYFAEI